MQLVSVRQRRQASADPLDREIGAVTPGIDQQLDFSGGFGQGTGRWLSPPPLAMAVPEPFLGESPAGIDYICRAVDLPDPDAMALSLGFDLETFNRRTDLWRHKASLSPSLGGEIRLAQLTGADSKTTLIVDVAVIGQQAIDRGIDHVKYSQPLGWPG